MSAGRSLSLSNAMSDQYRLQGTVNVLRIEDPIEGADELLNVASFAGLREARRFLEGGNLPCQPVVDEPEKPLLLYVSALSCSLSCRAASASPSASRRALPARLRLFFAPLPRRVVTLPRSCELCCISRQRTLSSWTSDLVVERGG